MVLSLKGKKEMEQVAIMKTDRQDIADIMGIEKLSTKGGGSMDLSDIGTLKMNMRDSWNHRNNAIIFHGGNAGDSVEFAFTKEGIDVTVEGRVMDSAKMFIEMISELQNEYMLVKVIH